MIDAISRLPLNDQPLGAVGLGMRCLIHQARETLLPLGESIPNRQNMNRLAVSLYPLFFETCLCLVLFAVRKPCLK